MVSLLLDWGLSLHPCTARQILSHWTTREIPDTLLLLLGLSLSFGHPGVPGPIFGPNKKKLFFHLPSLDCWLQLEENTQLKVAEEHTTTTNSWSALSQVLNSSVVLPLISGGSQLHYLCQLPLSSLLHHSHCLPAHPIPCYHFNDHKLIHHVDILGDSLVHWLRIHLPSRRCRFDPRAGKIPWKRKWQPTPVFLPGNSSWTGEPGGLQFVWSQRARHDWATNIFTSLPDQGLNPGPLHWEHGFLATEPPGKSPTLPSYSPPLETQIPSSTNTDYIDRSLNLCVWESLWAE